jgi:hypothetical protein
MTDQDQPQKRPRGRPPKYAGEGKRQNFSFRITPAVRERLIAAVQKSGRSLSEEIEFRLLRDLNWEEAGGDINKALAKAAAIGSAAYVHALRAAGLMILRDIEARPTRVIIDLETLLAEADGIARALRPGFFDPKALPTTQEPQMTAEQGQRLFQELERSLAVVESTEKKSA